MVSRPRHNLPFAPVINYMAGTYALGDFRLEYIGFAYQAFNLITVLSALENVTLPLIPYRKN
jgi:ABC-type lipoprotein export system ATPase subunit